MPVAASKLDAGREVLLDGKQAAFVDPKDPWALLVDAQEAFEQEKGVRYINIRHFSFDEFQYRLIQIISDVPLGQSKRVSL